MNYSPCQFLDEYLPSVDTATTPKKNRSSVYQQQTISSKSSSLSLSSSSSSSPSSSSPSTLSAHELKQQQQRVEHNATIHPVSAIDHFYTTNRTNVYYPPPPPPVSDTTSVIDMCTASSIDYNNNTYYFVSTHRSIIQQCSDTFFLLTGYSPLELIGKSLADFLHPDDLYHYGHQVATNFPFIRFYKKNGQTLPLECKKITNFTQDEVIYIGIANTSNSAFVPDTMNAVNVNSEFQIPSCCMNSAAITSNSSSNLYNHRDILLRNYVCVDCGTTASPEWRRGPHGPKTLCNACGLRWAKKNKRK